jgi:hypothetical protein
MSTNFQSDSDAPARSVSSRSPSASGAIAKPPGAQIRYDRVPFPFPFLKKQPPIVPLLTHVNSAADALVRRKSSPIQRALQAQEGRPTPCSSSIRTTPQAFECACSSTFLPPRFSSSTPTMPLLFPVTRSLSSSFHSPSSHPYSSFTSPPKSSALSPSKKGRRVVPSYSMTYAEAVGKGDVMRFSFSRTGSRFHQPVCVTRIAYYFLP